MTPDSSVLNGEALASGLVAYVGFSRYAVEEQDPPQKFPYQATFTFNPSGVL